MFLLYSVASLGPWYVLHTEAINSDITRYDILLHLDRVKCWLFGKISNGSHASRYYTTCSLDLNTNSRVLDVAIFQISWPSSNILCFETMAWRGVEFEKRVLFRII